MGFGDPSRYVLERIGATIPAHRRSLWVHGDTPLQFDAARQLIQTILADRPHVALVVTSRRLRTLQCLRSTFANEQTLPVPCGVGPAIGRFIGKLQIRHILLLDGGRTFPHKAIRLAISKRTPISAVNVGNPAALDGALLEAVRQHREFLRLCVFDEAVEQQLRGMGIAAESIAVTGCLDLEAGRALWPATAAMRRLLLLREDTPVAAAIDIPKEEERLVLDAFAEARHSLPDMRLLFEPRGMNQLARLRKEVEQRGWKPLAKFGDAPIFDPIWDVFLSAAPGNLIPLLPMASAAIAGGTYNSSGSGAVVAAAVSAGTRVLVGPQREFDDVPWRFLKASPLIQRIENGDPAAALCEALRVSTTAVAQASLCLGDATKRTYEAIAGKLPESPELPIVAQDWKVPTLRDGAGSSRIWRSVAPALMKSRIDSWGDLARCLGHPRSVLCLGDGPSSEDPRLAGFAHECLIRVNWRWKLRGFLANPQIVFVGDPATLHKLHHGVFGFWNTSLEYGMLLRHTILHGLLPMKYFTMDRLSPIVRDRTWPARPTNGALMIAAGAALAPEQLIIAGIDLYRHPDGRYSGDLLGNNEYARSHSRDTDLGIIRSALAQYRGELIILSDILRGALNHPSEVSTCRPLT